jgi:serine/threonine-protein kinase
MVASAGSRTGRVPALTKYDVIEELGHGGMATVYRAHDARLARDVAVKVLHPHLRESSEIAHRFAAEAKAVAKLRHPNIVEVFDVSGDGEQEQYLVVEFVRGETLRKILQRTGALPPEIGAAIAVELLGALAHAHGSGVVHRDVKPENVLIEHRSGGSGAGSASGSEGSPSLTKTPIPTSSPPSGGARKTPVESHRGERVFVKLTDFGIAKLLDAQGVTSTGQVLGSPAHMAPEQIEGGEVDGRADVFGLGVLLYECMVGHLPFEGNNPAQVLRRVLDGIYPSAEREKPIIGKVWSQILDRALARKPDARFASAEAMREAIAAELARVGVASPRAELERWFDDPEAWSAEHDERLIARLCELGAAARKDGDAVAAAADYNRALAYAPNDPHLLRIVSSMHRAEARMRFVRRTGPLVLGTIALGAGAFFVARAVKDSRAAGGPSPAPTESLAPAALSGDAPRGRVPTGASAATAEAPAPSSSEHRAHISTAPVRSTAVLPPAPAPVKKERKIRIASLRPAFGVHLAIDGAPAPDPQQEQVLALDDKPHSLAFTCVDDMCEPKTIAVPAGDQDDAIAVSLRVPPASLVVEGDPTRSYRIDELPGVALAPGHPTEIPIVSGGARLITVFDVLDPSKKQTVKVQAGKQKTISFQ